MDRPRIAVLRVLDEEDHEERDDHRSGVDDELPCVGEPTTGPVIPHTAVTSRAIRNAQGLPARSAILDAVREKAWLKPRAGELLLDPEVVLLALARAHA